MHTKESVLSGILKQVENKVLFWALLGPFILMLTLLVAAINPHTAMPYLPLMTVLGIGACWLFSKKGLLFAILGMIIFMGIAWLKIPQHERFWHLGLYLALTLGFVVTSLSLEEMRQFVQELKSEKNLKEAHNEKLGQALTLAQDVWNKERVDVDLRLEALYTDNQQCHEKIQSLNKSLSVVQTQCVELEQQKQNMHHELLSAQEQIVALRMKMPSQEQVDYWMQLDEKFQSLQSQLLQKAQEFSHTQSKLVQSEQSLENLNANYQELQIQLKHSEDRAIALEEQKQALTQAHAQMTAEWQDVQKQKNATQETLAREVIVQENIQQSQSNLQALEEELNELRHQMHLFKQLKKQFDEKTNVLHETRVLNFTQEGQLLSKEREEQEKKCSEDIIQKKLLKSIDMMHCELENVEKENKALIEIVNSLTNSF